MKKGGIIILSMLLIASFITSSAVGNIVQADIPSNQKTITPNDYITITFFDCSGPRIHSKEYTLTKSELSDLKNELREIRETSISTEESIQKQIDVFKCHQLISNDITYETLQTKINQKSLRNTLLKHRLLSTPLINNSVFNAMCAIDFELINGTTAVFGLNTFINYIGFDIISFHYGYAVDGIDTKGIIQRSNEPGRYVGTMFGFLGFWLGEKTIAGFYTNVTAAGFSVITAWVPVPEFS